MSRPPAPVYVCDILFPRCIFVTFCDILHMYNSVEVWNPQYRYRCTLSQGTRWHLPVVDSAISSCVWLGARRILAVGFENGKVVLAGVARVAGRGAVNHADVKDKACITLM